MVKVMLVVKNPPANAGEIRFNPWVGKIPCRRAWHPRSFLPGESHGQRSLAGCSPWVTKNQTQLKRLSTLARSSRQNARETCA